MTFKTDRIDLKLGMGVCYTSKNEKKKESVKITKSSKLKKNHMQRTWTKWQL